MLSGATVLAPFLLLLLFLFLFFGSAHAAAPARGCWLSRSTEVASNRIPAQQTIVRSKEIALQKYTESAACKSKKACLRGVCVDRSRLHFTMTDGRRTRRRTKRRSLRWRKRGWRRLSPVRVVSRYRGKRLTLLIEIRPFANLGYL